jgi:hypothetical protein
LTQKTYVKYFKAEGISPGQYSLTVSASGIPSQRIDLRVLDTKPTTFKLTTVKPPVNYDFPILIQLCNSGGNPSVSSAPIQVNIVSSNASDIMVPSKIVIKGDNSELVFYARALTVKQTSITVSSPGFKSTTIPLMPSNTLASASLVMSSKMPMNKPTDVRLVLTVDGKPVEGTIVKWIGLGFSYDVSSTDVNGAATNSFTLSQKEEFIEAKVQVGAGYISASKTIVAVPDAYHLIVTSNVPVEIAGSGTYSYGEKVTLEAPNTAPMPHILGLLGGKYVFLNWVGSASTNTNSVTLTIEGEMTELSAEAMYASDYNMLLIVVGVIVVLLIVGFVLYRKYGSKILAKNKKKPNEKVAPVPVVKPSPIRH